MNWVDIILLGVIALSAILAFFHGLVREALGVAGWVDVRRARMVKSLVDHRPFAPTMGRSGRLAPRANPATAPAGTGMRPTPAVTIAGSRIVAPRPRLVGTTVRPWFMAGAVRPWFMADAVRPWFCSSRRLSGAATVTRGLTGPSAVASALGTGFAAMRLGVGTGSGFGAGLGRFRRARRRDFLAQLRKDFLQHIR